MKPELLLVGRVQRPHGLQGEVSVEVVTAFPERFAPGSALVWRRDDREKPLTLRGARPHGDRLLLAFDGVEDIEQARQLQGGDLCVPAAQAYPAPEDFYYSHRIRGWACEDRQGRLLGRVAGLARTPAGPMLSIEVRPDKEALVPFVHGIVIEVDREARRIVLDPPEGLLDL